MSGSGSTWGPLSRRGQFLWDHEAGPSKHYTIPEKWYDKDRNPEGVINLTLAENSLMAPELLEYIRQHFVVTLDHLRYRQAIIYGFTESVIEGLPVYINNYAKPVIPVTPNHCVPGPGLGALLAEFVWAVCNEGDGVLLTTPFYDMYSRSTEYPACAKLVAVHIPPEVDPLGVDCIKYIEQAIETSNAQGTQIRVLLLCNPHNPLASAYPIETIQAYTRIAQTYDLHLLVDEVFANQVFPSSFVPDPPPFISILSIQPSCDLSRIHVLAAPTKDFGASGIKLGAFISQHNPVIVKLIRAAVAAVPISSAADATFAPILHDREFCEWFLEENRRRIQKAFERVAGWCVAHGIPFVPASAGVFFLLDLEPILNRVSSPGSSLQQKLDAAVASLVENGVFMRPTTTAKDQIPTRFRIVFTLPEDTMKLALERIENAFSLPHIKLPNDLI